MASDSRATFERPPSFDAIDFADRQAAVACWDRLARTHDERVSLQLVSGSLVSALSDASAPDESLHNVDRYLDAVADRSATLAWLAETPRAVEILVRLFVGSPSLTELLLREPERLAWLTNHRKLTDFLSREEFVAGANAEVEAARDANGGTLSSEAAIAAICRYQRRELLRIAACDTFHLFDFKTATRQLSLLADAIVGVVLGAHADELGLSAERVAVIAFGKLGGLELNYSSDIDLVFLGETGDAEEVTLAQRTIRSLANAGSDGFLYRVDMRLRPWGQSGPLVTTDTNYLKYVSERAELWEKQAMLKARVIAGNFAFGEHALAEVMPLVFATPAGMVRANVLSMKEKIERSLARRGRSEGHVKSGEGGIRDVEFVTQFLQLTNGHERHEVRTQNTNDALLRLFDVGALEPDEYRALSAGYLFHRVVEHALQLYDMSARHELPTQPRAIEHLARRLDFPSAAVFMKHYRGHCAAVRTVFDEIVGDATRIRMGVDDGQLIDDARGVALESTPQVVNDEQWRQQLRLRRKLGSGQAVIETSVVPVDDAAFDVASMANRCSEMTELTVVGRDRRGDLAVIAGLLQAYGFDIVAADADPGLASVDEHLGTAGRFPWFVDRFRVFPVVAGPIPSSLWDRFEGELIEKFLWLDVDPVTAQTEVANRVADAVRADRPPSKVETLARIEVLIDEDFDDEATVLQVRTEDEPGVLFNVTTALALARLDVRRVTVRTEEIDGRQWAVDTFHVVGRDGEKLRADDLLEIRAAIVLTTQFTKLLPHSPEPKRSLRQFREFLENLFARPGWMSDLSSLQDSRTLLALTQLLGVSEFLWDDFLRFQHESLFPVVSDVEGLQEAPTREELVARLREETLSETATGEPDDEAAWITAVNRFKDREMLRADMRHILDIQTAFTTFGQEITDIAEVVVECVTERYAKQFDVPLDAIAVCALGKCGGREMGFASDIELMFVYDDGLDVTSGESGSALLPDTGQGVRRGPALGERLGERIEKMVTKVVRAIRTPRDGIFAIDLRLRPHGQAGSTAVSLTAFIDYFGPEGPAWPAEQQALVKLRPIPLSGAKGDFAARVVVARDEAIYGDGSVDLAAKVATRERQVRQLVEAGTFNAKLSPGALVDIEYSVQVLQLRFGYRSSALRSTNTRDALKALEAEGVITAAERVALREAYRFFRRVINALRMVRGDAHDLTLPPPGSPARLSLLRRLETRIEPSSFEPSLQLHTEVVLEFVRSLPERLGS